MGGVTTGFGNGVNLCALIFQTECSEPQQQWKHFMKNPMVLICVPLIFNGVNLCTSYLSNRMFRTSTEMETYLKNPQNLRCIVSLSCQCVLYVCLLAGAIGCNGCPPAQGGWLQPTPSSCYLLVDAFQLASLISGWEDGLSDQLFACG